MMDGRWRKQAVPVAPPIILISKEIECSRSPGIAKSLISQMLHQLMVTMPVEATPTPTDDALAAGIQ